MLSIIITLFILLLVFLFYLFFAPFYIEINSLDNLYRFRLHRAATVSFKFENEEPFLEVNCFGWIKRKRFLNAWETSHEINPTENKKVKITKQVPYGKILNVIRSFRINKCKIDLDLGDMQLNGLLYPAFAWMSWRSHKEIAVNFVGRNEVSLEIQNSIARMSWAYISSKL